MSATQQIVTVGEYGLVALYISKPTGSRVRVWVFDEDETPPNDTLELACLQEATWFARAVLANPAEDVWNDL
ncbi:MAG: hypothetical protein RKR03_19140 [Candidatus Competibacter sp.]|nr:hypothetical protein [Candidatus Competibacter sp.]